jgi:antitoxin component of MazEF toxin-antitoxin module
MKIVIEEWGGDGAIRIPDEVIGETKKGNTEEDARVLPYPIHLTTSV